MDLLIANVLRGVCPAVSHHVRSNDSQTLREEEADLVAPSQRQIRPPVNQEDGTNCCDTRRLSKEEVIMSTIEGGIPQLDH